MRDPENSCFYMTALLDSFERYADRTAIVHSGESITYGELQARIYRLARALAEFGLRRGDGVAVLADNTPGTLMVSLASQLLGCYFVGIPTHAAAAEQAKMLAFTEVSALVYEPVPSGERADDLVGRTAVPTVLSLGPGPVGKNLLELAAEQSDAPLPPQGREEDIADLAFTGGSTGGQPKAAAFTFERLGAKLKAWLEISRQGSADTAAYSAPNCRLLRFAPATDTPGVSVLPNFLHGGTLVLQQGFDAAAVFRAIEQDEVTVISLYPSHLYQLLDHPAATTTDLSSLRLLVYYGAPASPTRLRQAVEAFGPVLFQVYGSTETRMMSTLQPADHTADSSRLRSVGKPRPGVELEIRTGTGLADVGEIGEICVRTAYRMNHYWREPGRTDEAIVDGWSRTGDFGYWDSEGYLYLADRQRDIVMVNALNCYTVDIENVLTTHSAVRQAIVVGLPDPKSGEAVHAGVVVHADREVTEAELCELVRTELGENETPRTVLFLDEVPVTRRGKPDKNAVRTLVSQHLASDPMIGKRG